MSLNITWRFISLILLLLYIALVVLTLILFIHNIGVAITLVLTSLLLVYSIWLIFSGTERDKNIGKWLSVIAVTGLTIEFSYFVLDQKNRRGLFLIVGLTIVYLLFLGLLRKRYWTLKRKKGKATKSTANFKNPYLIINPKSGNGRAVKAHIDTLAKNRGINVIMTQKGKDIEEIALDAVKAGADILGISGGDGSIGAVAKVAINHDLPIVVLPGGTRCHFARDLGLDPKQIVDSLEGFKGVERRIDVGNINGRIFLNNASFGLYADIVNDPDYRENKVQVSRKVLQALSMGTKQPYDLSFRHKNKSFNKAIQVLVGVNRYNTINLLELGQRSRLDEGVLQITVVTKLNNEIVKQLLKVMSIMPRTGYKDVPGFYQWTGKTFVVKSPKNNIVVGVDGESEAYSSPVKIHVMQGALRVYLPAEGVRNRPKNPISFAVIQNIWQMIRR